MKKLLLEFNQFIACWRRYISKRLHQVFFRFEGTKDSLVSRLTFGRGKLARPFVHTGMASLVILGMALAPLIASSYPDLASNPWHETAPSSAVLSAIAQEETSTIISDKPRSEVVNYTVGSGDTVSSIAKKFDVSVDTIRWANSLPSISSIKPGQTLKILPVTGILHKVTKGETIYSISKRYQADAQSMIDYPFNSFSDDETFALAAGQSIIVPDGVMPNEKLWSPGQQYVARRTPDAGAVSAVGAFVWPTSGNISQGFRWYHQAIDIANKAAPAILAADAGKVMTAGWPDNVGYGNRVIIDHGNGYKTLYAHLSKVYVSVGQSVNRGDQIGQMGSTGRSTGIHVHFEVYKGGTRVDPLSVLK